MREIKCRGQRIDNGEWIYGYLIGEDVVVGEIIDFDDEYFTTEFWYKVVPETVGQFTGLYDNKKTEEYPNGQPIYEGDKIALENITGIVEWQECKFIVNWPVKSFLREDLLFWINEREIEVIGNIHEREK